MNSTNAHSSQQLATNLYHSFNCFSRLSFQDVVQDVHKFSPSAKQVHDSFSSITKLEVKI